jgi:hypothetical protein
VNTRADFDLGFGLWALGFGLWALGFGLWALGFGLWALILRVKNSTQTTVNYKVQSSKYKF